MRITLEQTEAERNKKKVVIEVENDFMDLDELFDDIIIPAIQGLGFSYVDRKQLAEFFEAELCLVKK